MVSLSTGDPSPRSSCLESSLARIYLPAVQINHLYLFLYLGSVGIDISTTSSGKEGLHGSAGPRNYAVPRSRAGGREEVQRSGMAGLTPTRREDESSDEVGQILRVAFAEDAGREGYYTAGHEAAVTASDVEEAKISGSNLMYGEFLPAGFEKAMDEDHLWAARGGTMIELGSGTGKPALQALLQYPFTSVIGVELCAARHEAAARAMRAVARVA